MKENKTILEVNQVVKTFELKSKSEKKKLTILDQLSFSVEQGESVAVLGKSGSGKSTFLSLIAGLDQPDSGDIIINGNNIAKMSEKELSSFRSRKIAIIFQQFHLLPHLNALDNVSLPLELMQTTDDDTIKKEAETALIAVGLGDRMDHFPRELSGGEQQRVAIARALVVKPDLLLADEPTGNLDNQTNQEVSNQFFRIIKENNLSLVLVTHDESISKKCDKRFFLNQGKLEQTK